MTNARGIGIIANKQLLCAGGKLADLSEQTIRDLDAFLPPTGTGRIRIHLLRDADTARYAAAAEICLKDPGVDGLLSIYTPQDFAASEELAEALVGVASKTEKPLLTAWMGGRDVQRGCERMVAEGIPAYETAEAAVRAYIYMTQYERNLELLQETPAELPLDEAPPKNHLKALIRRANREACSILTEDDSRKFLRNYGIPVIPSRMAITIEDALAAALDMGIPRGPQGCLSRHHFPPGRGRRHHGHRLRGGAEDRLPAHPRRGSPVRPAGEGVGRNRPEDGRAHRLRTHPGGEEGSPLRRRDPVRQWRDQRGAAQGLLHRPAAVEPDPGPAAHGGDGRLPHAPGLPGKPPADLRQLEKILVGLSRMIIDFPEIREMDINPLAICQGKAIALDARILLDPNVFAEKASAYAHLVITPIRRGT